ncbi:MAG: hypothetical protein A3F41_02580 [Coxiella sp. RIFCSPHIGHO2_12_FULL_44_14]|nr:MAG: hypothetical protein A3F41_02580 [Coxiella sp. RIFCSPHIGHO2_12_FULL_44_14]
MSGLVMCKLTLTFNSQWQNALSFMQEQGRFMTRLLTDRIHHAGDAHCEHGAMPTNPVLAINALSANTHPFTPYEADGMIIGECLHYQAREQFIRMQYFIDDTGRKDDRGDPILALYQKPFQGPREEWVTGVVALKIRYGLLSRQGTLEYVSSNAVPNWQQVRSVSIWWLIKTIDRIPSFSDSFYFDGERKTVHDHHGYRSWHVFIALRERT